MYIDILVVVLGHVRIRPQHIYNLEILHSKWKANDAHPLNNLLKVHQYFLSFSADGTKRLSGFLTTAQFHCIFYLATALVINGVWNVCRGDNNINYTKLYFDVHKYIFQQNLLAETQRKLSVLTSDTNGYKKLLEGLIAQVCFSLRLFISLLFVFMFLFIDSKHGCIIQW